MIANEAYKMEKGIKEWVSELNTMIQQGEVLHAFEKFYADEVTMQENENDPTIGKDSCRQNEEAFVNGITAFRKADVKRVMVSEGLSVVEWEFDYSHKDWGDRKYTQLAVQRWNEAGQIINEKFYYNN